MIREPIYAALFALVAGAASFVTVSRRLRHWSDVGAAEQPALFMIQKSENAEERRPLPVKWRASVDLYLYAQAPDELTSPADGAQPAARCGRGGTRARSGRPCADARRPRLALLDRRPHPDRRRRARRPGGRDRAGRDFGERVRS